MVGTSSNVLIKPRLSSTARYWVIATIPIAIYTFIEGFRNDVGVDFKQNRYIFEFLQKGRLYRLDVDPLYLWINKMLVLVGFDFPILFLITSFLFIFSFYYLIRDKPYMVLFALPTYLLYSLYAENLIRQFFALSLLVLGLSFLLKNKWITFYVISVIAFFIHSSSIVAILFYSFFHFISSKNIKLKLWYILPVYFASWYVGITVFELLKPLVLIFNYLGIMANYTSHVDVLLGDSRLDLYFTASVFGNAFHFVRNLLLLIIGHSLLQKYPNREYRFFYMVFILYACTKPMFYRHELLDRLVHYFEVLLPVLVGYIAYDAFFTKHKNIFVNNMIRGFIIIIIAFNIYSYYGGIQNNAKVMKHGFLFVWDR
jgi:hypothetical protein